MANYIDWLDEDGLLKPDLILNHYKHVFLFYDHGWEEWRQNFNFTKINENNPKFILFNHDLTECEIKPFSEFLENVALKYPFQSFIVMNQKSILNWCRDAEISIYATNEPFSDDLRIKIKEQYDRYTGWIDRKYQNWHGAAAKRYNF